MWFELANLELSIFDPDLRGAAAARLGLKPEEVRAVRILRRSVDARQHRNVRFQYQLAVETPDGFHPPASANAQPFADESDALQVRIDCIRSRLEKARRRPLGAPAPSPAMDCATVPSPGRMPGESGRDAHAPVSTDLRPVVIGAGPAGLFAALALAECGLRPLIVERGRPAETRAVDVDRFWTAGHLDTESNMYFGEGGAGTFSDGKLNTRSKNPAVARILRELAACGAPAEILYDAKPHIGTDRLLLLLPRLRQRLTAAGATFLFNTRLDGVRRSASGILECELRTSSLPVAGSALRVERKTVPALPLVVACGHSAFDTWRMLMACGVPFEVKATAVGCRMEHPAEFVTRHFYGPDPRVLAALGNVQYNLAVPVAAGAGSAYSFCCCPGGEVVACASVPGQVSVNGMSASRRDSPFTNAGLVTGVTPEMMGRTAAEALAWREALERRCFELGGGAFGVPGQTAADFVAGRATTRGLRTSSRRPVAPTDLGALLPAPVAERLREGLRAMDRKIPGWIRRGALLGIETTTSSPVRIVRTPQGGGEGGWPDLLPVGEGGGHAGGIVTSALDGYETALRWLAARLGC